MMRLLLGVCILLLVAWLGMKLMSYRGDLEAMLRDVENWFGSLGRKIGDLIGPIRSFVESNVNELVRSAQKFTGKQ